MNILYIMYKCNIRYMFMIHKHWLGIMDALCLSIIVQIEYGVNCQYNIVDGNHEFGEGWDIGNIGFSGWI